MADTYVPSQPKNVVPLDYLNTQLVSKQNQITVNANKNTAQDARLDKLETLTTPMESRFVAIETKNTEQDNRLTATEIKANNAEVSANDYAANKADFVRVSDIASSIVNIVDIALTESGNNVIATLPVSATAGMTNGKLVRMKLIRTNVSPNRVNYLEDDLDNNSITQNTLALEGTSYECSATLEVATLTISGLAQAQRTILVGNYRLVQLEQTSSQAGTAIDATARQAAAAADTKAVAAQTDATYAKTKVDTIDLTPLTTGLANTKATADSALAKSNANESKIGSTTLTTTAQTMSGAIEEVNGAYKAAVALKANANLKVASGIAPDDTAILVDISDMDGKANAYTIASVDMVGLVTSKLIETKQDTLTKTITLTFDDNTTETIKVG